jgi:hypothetical protein
MAMKSILSMTPGSLRYSETENQMRNTADEAGSSEFLEELSTRK